MFCNIGNITCENHDALRELIKKFMKISRYEHTLGVESEAVKLAGIFEMNTDAEFISSLKSAALLHDITKEFDRQMQYKVCRKYSIKLSKEDKLVEKSLHSKTGAHIAKEEFGANRMVVSGIYNHTLGSRKNFSMLDKIIYLADYTEETRIDKDCVDVRNYFYEKIEKTGDLKEKLKILDQTVLYSLNKTIEVLIQENSWIHSEAVACRNTLLAPVYGNGVTEVKRKRRR